MELSPQHNVSVDMSLARGLRGAVMKQITSSRLAMDRAGEMVFTRKVEREARANKAKTVYKKWSNK